MLTIGTPTVQAQWSDAPGGPELFGGLRSGRTQHRLLPVEKAPQTPIRSWLASALLPMLLSPWDPHRVMKSSDWIECHDTQPFNDGRTSKSHGNFTF